MGNKTRPSPAGALTLLTRRRLRLKALAALILYLGLSPLLLLPGAYLAPDALFLALLLPAVALALTFLAGLWTEKKRKRAFLLVLLLQTALAAALLLPRSPLMLVLLLPCLAAMLLFMPVLARPSGLEWSGQQLALGAAVHVIGQILKGRPEFAPAQSLVTLFFCVYMILCLFILNRYALLEGTGEKQSPPAKILSQNRILISLLAVAALLLSGWRMLKDAAFFLWDILLKAIAALIAFFMQLFPEMTPIEGSGGEQGFDFGGLGEQAPPSLLSMILEKLMIVIGILLSLAILGFALYHLGKLIKRALKSLLERFRAYTKSIGEGYVDKTENLFDMGQISRAALEKWSAVAKRLKRLPPIDRLPPKEKVRRVYAVLRKRMPEQPDSLTAREALSSSSLKLDSDQKTVLAALYEQARYSDQPITPDQADTMRKNAGL